MASNNGPRKFSEKIALLTQREIEGNAEFDKIIGEVKGVKARSPVQSPIINNSINNIIDINCNNNINNNNSHINSINSNNVKNINNNNVNNNNQNNICITSTNLNNNIVNNTNNNINLNQTQYNKNHLTSPNDQTINFDYSNAEQNLHISQQIYKPMKVFEPLNLNNPILTVPSNQEQPYVTTNNSYLQIPPSTDTFRRAHSDSSLHQTSIGNTHNLNNNNNNNNNNNTMNNSFINQNNNQYFNKIDMINNTCCPVPQNPNLMTNDQDNQFNFLPKRDNQPINYNEYDNSQITPLNHQNELVFKTSNTLMPNSQNLSNNSNQNTFASLPDLTAFQGPLQENLLMPSSYQHTPIGAMSPTRSKDRRYSPIQSNRRASPQRTDRYYLQSPTLQNSPDYMMSTSKFNYAIQNSQVQNGIYRNTGNESMPPSPQSQPSCFNSPQGSPGPHSINAQDMNQFSYETIQKKFDSINLDTQNSYSKMIANNNPSSGIVNNVSLCNTLNNPINTNNQSNPMTHVTLQSNPKLSYSKSNSYNTGQMNLTRMNNDTNSYNSINGNYVDPDLNTMYACNSNPKPHKNSIPDIILTCSDSLEDKTEILKVLSTETFSEDNEDISKNDDLFNQNYELLSDAVDSQFEQFESNEIIQQPNDET